MIMKQQFKRIFGGNDSELIIFLIILSSNENYKHFYDNKYQQIKNNFKYTLSAEIEKKNLNKSFEYLKMFNQKLIRILYIKIEL